MSKVANGWELIHLHGGVYDEDYVAIDVGPVMGSNGLTAYPKGVWEMSAHEYHAAPRLAESNGHLMVAAPELYEACKAALAYLNDQDKNSWMSTAEQLRMAIARAEEL